MPVVVDPYIDQILQGYAEPPAERSWRSVAVRVVVPLSHRAYQRSVSALDGSTESELAHDSSAGMLLELAMKRVIDFAEYRE